MPSPTIPPPRATDLSATLTRNIAALETRQKAEADARNWGERFADVVTQFAGSMLFVYLHAAIYGAWIAVNLGLIPGVPAFDKSFVILATEASVEAIFLSTFVLISQNRANVLADKRAELDLQVSLLAEHEVTRLISLVTAMAQKMGIEGADDPELAELAQDVAPERVLDEMEAGARALPNGRQP